MRYSIFLLAAGLFAVVFLLVCPSPAAAEGPVFANKLSVYLTSSGGRSHVIRICLVTMCLALFILMKKFSPDD